MTKTDIKACGMFGYELVEDVVTDATLYQSGCERLQGTLCRTSSGIRFIVDGGVYLAAENEEIDTVEHRAVPTTGCSSWKYFERKALMFKVIESQKSISFAVPDSVAKSWVKHFDVG